MIKRCYNKFSNSSDSNRLFINNIIKRINIFTFGEVIKNTDHWCSATLRTGVKIVKSPFIECNNIYLIKSINNKHEVLLSYMYLDKEKKQVNNDVLHPGHNRIIKG